MFARFRRWLLELLISIDQFFHVLLGGPKFILVGGPHPCADETISSKVGRRSIAGERWAKIAEKLIDTLFLILTGQPDHCARSIERVLVH